MRKVDGSLSPKAQSPFAESTIRFRRKQYFLSPKAVLPFGESRLPT
ncbi:MAG: hypothetical protein IKD33_02270 [Bacteroidales bacterium]|nr:hypothetical protein [Bacteroidales bacterium]